MQDCAAGRFAHELLGFIYGFAVINVRVVAKADRHFVLFCHLFLLLTQYFAMCFNFSVRQLAGTDPK
jgi:hypothetical protein